MAKKQNTKQERFKPDLSVSSITIENPRNVNGLYTVEFSGLNPNNLHYYLECSRKGVNYFKGLLFDETRRRDLRIGAVCQTRKLGVANKEWELTYKKNSTVPQKTQEDTINFIMENLQSLLSIDGEGFDLVNFITDSVEAQIQGVSTFELIYKTEGSNVYIDKAVNIPNHLLCFDDRANKYSYLEASKADAMRIRSLGWGAVNDRIDLTGLTVPALDPLKLIEVHSLDGNAQNGFMNGCIDSLIWAYLFKNYGLKDWSIFVERFAVPSVIATRPALMSKPDRETLNKAIKEFGHLWKIVVPEGTKIDFGGSGIDKSGTNAVFDNYINFWNKEISIRVLGQSLTTDIGDTGSKAAAQTHDQVRHDIMVADMLLVKKAVNALIRKLIFMNFGKVSECPVFSFEEEEDIEYKYKRSEIFKNLRLAGYRVIQEDVESEFDVRVEIAHTPGAAAEDNPGAGAGKTDGSEGHEGTDKENNYIKNFIGEFWNGIQQ